MIFEIQSYCLIFQDAVYALGIGFLSGFVYQFLGIFFYKGRKRLFFRDVITGLFFTTALFSYSVSFANYPVLRWYMAFFGLVGMIMFAPAFSRIGNKIFKIIQNFIKMSAYRSAKKICGNFLLIVKKNQKEKQKNTQKNAAEVLKENNILLYN